jgi:hypothetical protein
MRMLLINSDVTLKEQFFWPHFLIIVPFMEAVFSRSLVTALAASCMGPRDSLLQRPSSIECVARNHIPRQGSLLGTDHREDAPHSGT